MRRECAITSMRRVTLNELTKFNNNLYLYTHVKYGVHN